LGVLKIFHENTNLEIHISTQANITNKYTAMQYVELGAKRVILARELPLADIAEIAEYLHNKAVVEVFVHGAMCISYSGRCLLSNYLVGRESNRGDCAQPCRYSYALCEEKRQNEYYPIEEDERGSYILNSRDLCLINHIEELANAGVSSFKIEGRMKSEYYVGGVTNIYRRVMNGQKLDIKTEIEKISHRPYTTGFTFADKDKEYTANTAQMQTREIVGIVVGLNQIQIKNKLSIGDTVEILSPVDTFNKTFKSPIEANIPNQIVKITCPHKLQIGDILRK